MRVKLLAGLFVLFILAVSQGPGALGEKILFVGDLHLSGDRDPGILEAVKEAAAGCDRVVFLGDNTNNGHKEEHTAFLSFMGEVRQAGAGSVLALPGNHDLCGETTPAVWLARYAAYSTAPAMFRDENSLSAAVVENGLCLLLLDTNAYDPVNRMTKHGSISEDVLRWADLVLDSLPAGTEVIAAGHHPLIPYSGTDATEGAEKMVRCLTDHGVSVYFCGHRHGNDTVLAGELRQITVGVPWSWPAWAGVLETGENGWQYSVYDLLERDTELARSLREQARVLGLTMAAGSLKGTAYEGDEEAISWFGKAFMASVEGTLQEKREQLLEDDGCRKWREAQVYSVTKAWMLGLLESDGTEDVRQITVR